MNIPDKPDFTWEKEEVFEKDAYAIPDKGGDESSPIKKLLKKTSLQDLILLAEILNRPYS